MNRTGIYIGDDVWKWIEAPQFPPKKRTEPDDLAPEGLPLEPFISDYLRFEDGKLQQLWVWKYSSGQTHSYEWIDVPMSKVDV